jgi:uncharacterized protein YqhQ
MKMPLGRRAPEGGRFPWSPILFQKEKGPIRVGGQAVIEGVMMRSPNSMAIAVRKPDGEIVVKKEGLNFFAEKSFLFKFPLVRGIIALISALTLGVRALHFSANQALPEGEGQKEISPWTMSLTFALALSFGIFLFFLVPLFLTKGLKWFLPILSTSGLLFNLMDGLLRLAIFLAYIRAISFFKEIERVFQYHGAEHKSIFAFEAGEPLNVERVKGFGYLHPRCGTNFLLIVMVVSILVFALLPHHLPFGYKVVSRIVFIPFIAGLSYEIIRFADRKRNQRGVRFLIQPGLWLQRLTAKEPTEPQIEVALRALQEVLDLERRR